tara:strand:+ start:3860 stop:5479 length:1620 start_codon:yes stop_codon:yes gene_type:complete
MKKFVIIILFSFFFLTKSQNIDNVSGNLEFNFQTFNEDSVINAEKRKAYSRGYLNLIYNYEYLSIGTRFEYYKNPIPGFENFEDNGFPYKYVQYKNEYIDLTFGNFYEEFGNGLILRTYNDYNLGVDNSMSGIRFKTAPVKGLYITFLTGRQRSFWELSSSQIRAFNADISLNDLFLKNWNTYINFGTSFLTKRERDDNPLYFLPENVGASNIRLNIVMGDYNFRLDYANKINDPSADNNYIYKNGNALVFTGNYSIKGFGISFAAKRIENMSFRSERNAILQDLNINYITPFNKQQSYSLATIYPYVSQPNGEIGSQIDIYYNIPKKSRIGGKYGTNINLNFSNVYDIDKTSINQNNIYQSGTLGYKSNFFKAGDKMFQEINLEIIKKVNRKLKLISNFIMLQNDDKILKSQPLLENKNHENIYANIFILETIYKIKARNTLRFEIQHLNTKQHFKNWFMGLVEYKLSPNWFFSVQDMYNYGNPDKPHYYSFSFGISKNTSRLSLTAGKQRAGLFCVGGVCREVPASNGFSINLTSSF